MKIGIISTMWGTPWGGSEELWALTARRALAEGHQVSICIPFRAHPNVPTMQRLESAGAVAYSGSDGLRGVRGRQIARALGLLDHRLEEALRKHLSPLPAFFAGRPDVVLISDGLSIPDLEVIEAVEHYHDSKPYVMLSQSNSANIVAREHRQRAANFYEKASASLFVAEGNRQATERQLTRKFANARVVRNPVNLESTEAVPWPTKNTVSFALVARLDVSFKGLDIVCETFSEAQWRTRDWHLCLFGSGYDEAYLSELIKFQGLENRIKLRGQTNDIRGIWKEHQALILASRIEGTPLVLVEAMLCGRPYIGSPVAGIAEWVRDGHNGFLADGPSVKSLSAALETAWLQRERWEEMGRNAREDALGLYDPEPDKTLLSILSAANAAA